MFPRKCNPNRSMPSEWYQFPESMTAPRSLSVPAAKRVPFRWQAAGLGPGLEDGGGDRDAVIGLRWSATAGTDRRDGAPAPRLRFTVALDVREEKRVEVFLADKSGLTAENLLAQADCSFAHCLQLYDVLLPAARTDAVLAKGILLRQSVGTSPLFLFARTAGDATALSPHLLIGPGSSPSPLAALRERLSGRDVIQPFGLMEGCVLDGLHDLGDRRALEAHLNSFFPSAPPFLEYEDPTGEPVTGRVHGVEALLPFAALALTRPDHPALRIALEFCETQAGRRSDGLIADGELTTAGGYAAGYPLAVLAKRRVGDARLRDLAARQFTGRIAALSPEPDAAVYARTRNGKPDPGYRNWTRGVGWHLLGMARALPYLEEAPAAGEIRDALRRGCALAMDRQDRRSGLWFCYLDEPATGVETSGSAALAAGLAKAAALDCAPRGAMEAAARARAALLNHLTPDGYLTGASPADKSGPRLQKSGPRGVSPYAGGLLAQLIATTGGFARA